MSGSLTPEQTLERYKAVLGPAAGLEFYYFKQNFLYALHMWGVYKAMFEASERRVDLLNAASGPAAWTIQQAMRHAIILALCRLCDPAESGPGGRFKNLTVARIGASLEPNDEGWSACLAQVEGSIPDLRALRHKTLAHSDLPTATEKAQMSSVDSEKIEAVIAAIGLCVDHIFTTRLKTTYFWDLALQDGQNSGLSFLSVLNTGVEEEKRWRDAEYVRAFRDREGRFPRPSPPDWLKRS